MKIITEADTSDRQIPYLCIYFDMIECFCNSHDDVAVDVIQYDYNDKEKFRKTFRRNKKPSIIGSCLNGL